MGVEAPVTTPPFSELSARRLGPVRRFFVRRPAAMDALVVAVFVAWALLMGLGADSMYALGPRLGGDRVLQMQYASLALTVAGAVALAWRRRRPALVATAIGVLGVLALATTGATSGFEVGLALALYAVAAHERPRTAWLVAAGTVAAQLVAARVLALPATVGAITLGLDPTDAAALATAAGPERPGGFLQSPVWYQTAGPVLVVALLAIAVGTSVRNRREHLAAFVEAANALARDQEQRTRLAQAAERARIAREMHDVVAHSISVMVALGGGASTAFEWAPERSRAALDELVATGRSALGEMRRVLGVLDEDGPRTGGGEPAGAAPLGPQPGTVDLDGLVERVRAAGVPVRTSGLADTGLLELDAGLQLAVYRIVQEALTNTLRHAPATPGVEVGVERTADGVEVLVTDRGPGVIPGPTDGSGRGLVGMRERAAVFGGSVEAGPYRGGWRVRALLPWREDEA